MAEIKVSSEMLRGAAADIKQLGTQFNSVAEEFYQGMTSLQSMWEGDAFNSFKTQVDALKPSLERYYQVINDYATFLETSAEQYETTEAATQNETDNLVNNLFS